MNKISITIFLVLIFTSCSKNDYKKRLIGTWNNFPSQGQTEFRFSTDSIISYDYGVKRKGTWKADKSNIYFNFLVEIPGFSKKYNNKYTLSKDMESLILMTHKDSITLPTFFKINDYWNHFLREIDLQIELQKADFNLIENDSIYYGINIYVGYKNDTLFIKGDNGFQLDSLNIKYYVYSKRNTRKESEMDNMNFNLVVDKKISDNQVDSIKLILNKFPEMRIFRVYKNDAANYGKHDLENMEYYSWNWYGRFE